MAGHGGVMQAGEQHFDAAALEHAERAASRLEFEAAIEGLFRSRLADEIREQRVVVAVTACVVLLSFALYDLLLFDAATARLSMAVRFGVQLPTVVLAMLLLGMERVAPQPIVVTSLLLVGLGVVAVDSIAVAIGASAPPPTHLGLLLLTLATYLLCGLRLLPAIGVAAGLFGFWVLHMVLFRRAPAATLEGAIFLLSANAVCIIAAWRLEVARRSAFLRQQILSLVDGRDVLTGAVSRAAGLARLQALLGTLRREARPFGVALVAIDHLGGLNRMRGETIGDGALCAVAQCAAGQARRPLDFHARHGGDSFLVGLVDVSHDEFERQLEQLRVRVAALDLANPGSTVAPFVTVSIVGRWFGEPTDLPSGVLLESLEARLEGREPSERNSVRVVTEEVAVVSSRVVALRGDD